jgi:hypothetical protein
MSNPPGSVLSSQRRRRRWILAGSVIGAVWLLRLFISIITPDNPNPYITPLAVMTTLVAFLAPLVQTGRFGRSRMADATLILGSILFASAAALQLIPPVGDAHRVVLVTHLVAGVVVLIPVHLYLIGHLGDAFRRRPLHLIRSGIAGLLILLGCVWSGALMTFLQARELSVLAVPHQVTGWCLLLLCLLHIPAGRAILAQREALPSARRRFLVEGILPGFLLIIITAGIGLRGDKAGPWEVGEGEVKPDHFDLTDARSSHGELLSNSGWNWEPTTCSSSGGYCHIDNITQWKRSAHARSVNPAYIAVLERFEETRPGSSTYCAGCHSPRTALTGGPPAQSAIAAPHPPSLSVGVDGTFVSDGATGQATTIPPVPSGQLGDGVSCQVCHRSRPGEGGVTKNASYVISPVPADFVRTAAIPFFNFPMILADLDVHRGYFDKRDVQKGTDACASCHVHHLPSAVHPQRIGAVVADQLTSFKESRASAEGTSCVDCHMPKIYGPLDPTWTRSHAFPSGNTGLPWLLKLPERVEENQSFLADDKVRLSLQCDRSEGEVNDYVSCGVQIENVGVGHHFPAGPRDLIEVWVELTATADGDVVASRGALDLGGQVQDPLLTFRQTLFDANGEALRLHEFWLAQRSEGLDPLGPESLLTSERVLIPTALPVEVNARLRHRRYNADFIRAAFGLDHPLAPITDVASANMLIP